MPVTKAMRAWTPAEMVRRLIGGAHVQSDGSLTQTCSGSKHYQAQAAEFLRNNNQGPWSR